MQEKGKIRITIKFQSSRRMGRKGWKAAGEWGQMYYFFNICKMEAY
jgi:hypothetical protein